METQNPPIVLSSEDAYITGVPSETEIDDIKSAFEQTMRAQRSCREHYDQILDLDPSLRTDEDKAKMPSYEARLKRLQELSLHIGRRTDSSFELWTV